MATGVKETVKKKSETRTLCQQIFGMQIKPHAQKINSLKYILQF